MSPFVKGEVTRVGGDDKEMRVEIDTGKDVKTLHSYPGAGDQIASYVTSGDTYVFEYNDDGTITGVTKL